MVKLSINVNKIAVLRNSRGGQTPHLLHFIKKLISNGFSSGISGITVHPRPDGRHILYKDVRDIGRFIDSCTDIELNVEGRPIDSFLNLIKEVQPHQCTLVPDSPEALTSDQGWNLKENQKHLLEVLRFLRSLSIRSSLFIDPLLFYKEDLEALKTLSPDRVEFYTGAWAKWYEQNSLSHINNTQKSEKTALSSKILTTYKNLSEQIQDMGIGVNAGHDLNRQNLKLLLKACPLIQEISIGHAFVCESLYSGMESSAAQYKNILKEFQ